MSRGKLYGEWLDEFGLERLRSLAEEGLSENEIAERVQLNPKLLRKWKRIYPELAEALALGGADSDYHVINALYKKATGFNVGLKKTYKLKRVEFDPETGKKIREYEELATGVDETFVPADLSAEKYWLESRQGERWGVKCSVGEMREENEEGGVLLIPVADRIDGIDVDDESGAGGGSGDMLGEDEIAAYLAADYEENKDLIASPYRRGSWRRR